MIASSDESTIAARYSGDHRAGAWAGGSSLTGIGPGHCKPLASRRARTCVARLTFEPSAPRRSGRGPARVRERRSSLDLALLRPCAGAEGRGTMEGHSTKSLLRVISLALALSLAVALITPAAHAQAASPTTVYLPNVTKMLGGPDGWQTPFIVQNVGAAPTDLTVSFYSFADGSLVAQRHVTGLMPGTSYADVPNNDADLPAGGQFSVVVQSSAAPIVSVVNEHQGTGNRAEALSYVGLSSGALRVGLPYVAKDDNGWLTTFIIQNLGSAPTDAKIMVGTGIADATVFTTITPHIEPGRSGFVDPRQEATIPP